MQSSITDIINNRRKPRYC